MSGDRIPTGGPAFPCTFDISPFSGNPPAVIVQHGMSLRDYFAAKALAALVATECWEVEAAKGADRIGMDHIAAEAYALADAMLKARSA